jgi:hypothetical protein
MPSLQVLELNESLQRVRTALGTSSEAKALALHLALVKRIKAGAR